MLILDSVLLYRGSDYFEKGTSIKFRFNKLNIFMVCIVTRVKNL